MVFGSGTALVPAVSSTKSIRRTKMKQKLCIVLGIVMIVYVGVMVTGLVGINDTSLVVVSVGEAKLVQGGGERGYPNWISGGRCGGPGEDGCEGESGYVDGIQQGMGSGTVQGEESCGGSTYCANKKRGVPEDAPE